MTMRARRIDPDEDLGLPEYGLNDESTVDAPGWSILEDPAATAGDEESIACGGLVDVSAMVEVVPVAVGGDPDASSLMLPPGPNSLLFLGSTET